MSRRSVYLRSDGFVRNLDVAGRLAVSREMKNQITSAERWKVYLKGGPLGSERNLDTDALHSTCRW